MGRKNLNQGLFSLSSLSPFIPLSSSDVTVGFDQTVQSVDEGQAAMVTVSVMGESVTLDRDVVVTVTSTDGTASMLQYNEGRWRDYSSFSLTVGDIDYISLSMELTFNSVTISHMVTVTTSTDTVIENEETFTLALTENDDAVDKLMPHSVTVIITDQTSKYSHCRIEK